MEQYHVDVLLNKVHAAVLVVMVSRKIQDDSIPLLNIKRKTKKVNNKISSNTSAHFEMIHILYVGTR